MVFLILIGYILLCYIILKTLPFPRIQHLQIIFALTTFTYLIVMGVISLGRYYYSRSFLIISYTSNLFWLTTGYLLWGKKGLKFGVILSKEIDSELLGLKQVEFIILQEPREDIELDGIVILPSQRLSPEWSLYITKQTLKGIPVYNILDVYEILTGKIPIKYLYDSFLEDYNTSRIYPIFKRIFDVALVIITTPITIPICLVVSILIKIDSNGPIIFKQQRIGQGGKAYSIFKFRTMYTDAEKDGPRFAYKNDPRITHIGHILRRFRIDELPQFWNVLKGEMSLIGPRPEQKKFVEEFTREIPFYSLRHLVKPGITGWAQIHFGYASALEETREKLEYDLYYIKNLSLWLDIVIVLRTIVVLITRFGAR